MPTEAINPVRCVGLIGGTSPHSTQAYYHALIHRSAERLPPDVYPRIVIINMNFRPLIDMAFAGRWEDVAAVLSRECDALRAAGADFVALTANTIHKALHMLRPSLPVLSILDAVASDARARGFNTLAITGTKFVMADGFYQAALAERNVRSLTPAPDEQAEINRVVFEELVRGVVRPESVARYADTARRMLDAGADALLLGCTEQAMLTGRPDWPDDIPVLDSAAAHAEAIWRVCMGIDDAPR